MVDLKSDVITIAHQLMELHAHIGCIERDYSIHIWGVDDFLVDDVLVLAKALNLDPRISDMDGTYGHTKMVKIEIEGITFTSIYTRLEYEECYKKYTEVENNV